MPSPGIRSPQRQWFQAFATPGAVSSSRAGVGSERPALVLHGISLLAIAVIYAALARGQWFYYDEWDVLDPGHAWDLLAPHNGHLSLGIVVVFSALQSVVGLSTYLPYLAVAIVTHLVVVHLVWRACRRAGAQPIIGVLVAAWFGLLAAGAENTLWAFQLGFMAPIAFGLAAFEVIDGVRWNRTRAVTVILLLAGGILFSSTALPFFAVGVLFLFIRRGWRVALVTALVILVPYGAWRLVFVSGVQATDGFAAHSIGDYIGRVPQFLLTSLINSVAASGVGAVLAPVLLLAFALWTARELRRRGTSTLPAWSYILLVGLVFGLLVAVSRLHVGDDGAAGRYVYVYVATAAPAVSLAASRLMGSSRLLLTSVAVILVAVIGFNVVQLRQQAIGQAALEQFTRQSVLAALTLTDRDDLAPARRPLPVLAPTLTIRELEALHRAGQIRPGSFGDAALLSDEVNLNLKVRRVTGQGPFTDCSPSGALTRLSAGAPQLVELRADSPQVVGVVVTRDGVSSAYTRVTLLPGVQRLVGFPDAAISLRPPSDGAICVTPRTGAVSGE